MHMSKMYWVKGKINNEDFSGRFDSKRKIVKTILGKLGLKDESSLQFKKVDGENKWFIYLAEPKDGTYFAVTEMKTKPDNSLKINEANLTREQKKILKKFQDELDKQFWKAKEAVQPFIDWYENAIIEANLSNADDGLSPEETAGYALDRLEMALDEIRELPLEFWEGEEEEEDEEE